MAMFNPPHPGEFIHDVYMEPFGYSCRFVAKQLDVAASTLNRVIKGKSSISPEMGRKSYATLRHQCGVADSSAVKTAVSLHTVTL